MVTEMLASRVLVGLREAFRPRVFGWGLGCCAFEIVELSPDSPSPRVFGFGVLWIVGVGLLCFRDCGVEV